jgi:hypothetical protein
MNRLVIAPSILAADFGCLAEKVRAERRCRLSFRSSLRARRAQSLYCAIPATGRPTSSTEACLRKRRNKAIAPYGPHPDVS